MDGMEGKEEKRQGVVVIPRASQWLHAISLDGLWQHCILILTQLW